MTSGGALLAAACSLSSLLSLRRLGGRLSSRGSLFRIPPPFFTSRFCKDTFDKNYKATIGVDFEMERFEVLGVPFSLQL